MLRTKLAPSANAVASDKTATINLPIGQRYHTITLVLGYDASNTSKETGGTVANQILGEIRVKLNGKTQRSFTAKQLNAFNSLHDGRGARQLLEGSAITAFATADDTIEDVTATPAQAAIENNFSSVAAKVNQLIAGQYALMQSGTVGSSGYREYITIFLAEPWRKDVQQQQSAAWNIHPDDVKSFQIEADIKTITSPILDCFYTYDELTGRIGVIEKVVKQTFPVAGTSQDLNTIVVPDADYLRSIHLFATGDAKFVNKARLSINGEDVHDLIDYLWQRAKLVAWGMNPDVNSAGIAINYLSPRYDLVLDFDDPIRSVAGPGRAIRNLNLRVEFDASTSSTMDALIVRDGPPD